MQELDYYYLSRLTGHVLLVFTLNTQNMLLFIDSI